jgi:leader peptidase (prepilin peptidase)/N-methyltransferase
MIIGLLVLLGLVFGSFVNALVWRFHEQAELAEASTSKGKGQSKPKKGAKLSSESPKLSAKDLSMVHGRSMCSNCHHELAPKDLVPLLSWLWLRGKCRYCGVKIQDNPLVEVTTAVLFVISYLWWPYVLQGVGLFQFVVWLAFVVAFVALTVYDLRWFTLPNRIVFPLIALAVVEVAIVAITKQDWHVAVDSAAGAAILFGLFYVLFQVSGGTWIGGGDVKLAAALGLLAGSAVQSLLLLFVSSLIGTIVSIPQLMKGKSGLRAKVPFGPFLLAATVVVVLFGVRIIDWYTGLLT